MGYLIPLFVHNPERGIMNMFTKICDRIEATCKMPIAVLFVAAVAAAGSAIVAPVANATTDAPTPGHFVDFPTCSAYPDPNGGATITLKGTFAPQEKDARFTPQVAETVTGVPPTMSMWLDGKVQDRMVIPASDHETRMTIIVRNVSTLQASFIYTNWLDGEQKGSFYLFAGIYPLGTTADCIVSTN